MSDSQGHNWIVETSDAAFQQDVLARSAAGLVVVDFWAEWCAPCRALGPILEHLAVEYAGQFTLVKAEAEQTPVAAGQFQVSGIPAVFAVLAGEVVDFFQGLLPEASIRQWLDRLLQRAELMQATRLASIDPASAESKLRELLAKQPREPAATTALAALLAEQNRPAEARELISQLEASGYLDADAEKLRAQLDLADKASLDVAEARRAAAAAPGDFLAQFALAEALVGQEQFQEAFEICLDLVARDRQATGEAARRLMVEVFQALPADSDLTSEYRRRLSAALY